MVSWRAPSWLGSRSSKHGLGLGKGLWEGGRCRGTNTNKGPVPGSGPSQPSALRLGRKPAEAGGHAEGALHHVLPARRQRHARLPLVHAHAVCPGMRLGLRQHAGLVLLLLLLRWRRGGMQGGCAAKPGTRARLHKRGGPLQQRSTEVVRGLHPRHRHGGVSGEAVLQRERAVSAIPRQDARALRGDERGGVDHALRLENSRRRLQTSAAVG